ILLDVVAELLVDGGGYRVVGAAHEKRVAIGRRTGCHAGTKGATRSALVVDHHALTQLLPELLSERTGERVGAPACRERNHDGNGSVGPGGLRRTRHCKYGKNSGHGTC